MVGMQRGRRAASNSPIFGPINGIGNFVGYPLWSPVPGQILLIVAAARGFGGRRWYDRGEEAKPLPHVHCMVALKVRSFSLCCCVVGLVMVSVFFSPRLWLSNGC